MSHHLPDGHDVPRLRRSPGKRVAIGFDEDALRRVVAADRLQLRKAQQGPSERKEVPPLRVPARLFAPPGEVVPDNRQSLERIAMGHQRIPSARAIDMQDQR